MKVLIASLQVSENGSKGHLHPALELALECKRRGHELKLLPLPCVPGPDDRAQLKRANIDFIDAPTLPAGIQKTAEELAIFASDPNRKWEAYRSFLVDPLPFQYNQVKEILRDLKPDVVLYDMLVYAPCLAARELNIKEAGFCAGLKLIADDRFQDVYKSARNLLEPYLSRFLQEIPVQTSFKNLELLSAYKQFVFASPALPINNIFVPPNTLIAGSLPISNDRIISDNKIIIPENNFAVLSFGSVLDPADFKSVVDVINICCKKAGLELLISSKKYASNKKLGAFSYLPLWQLLPKASIFFHHGGANSFSEALYYGVPQILIPLSNDQPIQGDYLQRLNAGFSLFPNEITIKSLEPLIERLLDKKDLIHVKINKLAQCQQRSMGAKNAIDALELLV